MSEYKSTTYLRVMDGIQMNDEEFFQRVGTAIPPREKPFDFTPRGYACEKCSRRVNVLDICPHAETDTCPIHKRLGF